MIRIKSLKFALAGLVFWGCAAWERVGGIYDARDDGFRVEFPPEWNRNTRIKDRYLITRDGLLLQLIEVGRLSIDKDLPNTKRKLDKSMSPLEASEVVFDDIKSNQSIMNAQILENAPANVGGFPGFKLLYSCNTKEGLEKMGVYYGVLRSSHIYFLHYFAPARHYFQQDLKTLEKVRESFQVKI